MGFWQFATGGGSGGGSGDVTGPAGAVAGNIASFSGATGKVIADSGVAAASVVVGPSSATDEAFVRYDGATGKLVQNGVLTSADFNGDLTGPATNTATSGFGTAFTNQPANDKVTVVSDSALDITQTVTIIGNTNGTDTIVTEDIALNGLTGVDSVKADWGQILAVKLSAVCAGTVTIKETSGGLTITTIAPAATSAGVFSSSLSAFSRKISFSSNGATVKHAGIKGTNSAGATIYEGATLSGTTLVSGLSTFVTVSELYIGDLENNRPLIITSTGGTKLNSNYLVTGPTTAVTDNAIPRFDGTRSDLIQDSAVTIADTTGSITTTTTGQYLWSTDAGLARSAAGIVKVTDGSTGAGALLAGTAFNAVTGIKINNGSGHGAALYGRSSEILGFANLAGTVRIAELNAGGIIGLPSDVSIAWDPNAKSAASGIDDTRMGRIAAGQVYVSNHTNGMANNIKIATTTVNASGATSTATNLVPAGCILLGVTTRVTTAITSGDGGTSVDIGNGTDADMYGNDIAFTLGTTTNLASHTASALAFKSAAESVVFTCNGGTFSGGVWRVCAHFLDLTGPTS